MRSRQTRAVLVQMEKLQMKQAAQKQVQWTACCRIALPSLHQPQRLGQRCQHQEACRWLLPHMLALASPAPASTCTAAQLRSRKQSQPSALRCGRLGRQSTSWLRRWVMRRSCGPGTLCWSIVRWVLLYSRALLLTLHVAKSKHNSGVVSHAALACWHLALTWPQNLTPTTSHAPLPAQVASLPTKQRLLQSLIATPALAAYLVSGGRYTRSAFLAAISGMPRSPVAVRRNVGRRAVCLQRMHRQSTHCSWPNIGKPLISACFYHLAQASTAAAASSRLPTSGARCASWRSWRSRRTARAAGASAPSRWCVLRWGGVKINGCRPAAVGP